MLMLRGKCDCLLSFNDVRFIGIEQDIGQINYRFLYLCLYFLSFCLVLQEWKTSLTLIDCSHRQMRCNRVTSFYHGGLLTEMKADVYLMKNAKTRWIFIQFKMHRRKETTICENNRAHLDCFCLYLKKPKGFRKLLIFLCFDGKIACAFKHCLEICQK